MIDFTIPILSRRDWIRRSAGAAAGTVLGPAIPAFARQTAPEKKYRTYFGDRTTTTQSVTLKDRSGERSR